MKTLKFTIPSVFCTSDYTHGSWVNKSVFTVDENRFNVLLICSVCVLYAYFMLSLIPFNFLVKVNTIDNFETQAR